MAHQVEYVSDGEAAPVILKATIIVTLSLLILAVVFSPLNWLAHEKVPFWLGVLISVTWIVAWLLAVPAIVAWRLGWWR